MAPSSLRELAVKELAEGRRDIARALSQAAVKLSPNDIPALNTLGMIEFQSGHYERGIEILLAALEKSTGPAKDGVASNLKRCINVINKIAINHLKNGEIPECISAFNSVIMIEKYNWLAVFSLRFIVNNLYRNDIFDDFCTLLRNTRWTRFEQTFAQSYEDGRVLELLAGHPGGEARKKGIYVDIGAHHPLYLSVTAALHFMGWRGISIDPLPGAPDMFRLLRPDDVNLACAVGRSDGVGYINVTDDPTLSYISEDVGAASSERKIKVEMRRIDSILREHLPPGETIDVMNVDVEGGEDSVIDSNDWSAYRPYVLLLEDPLPATGGEPGRKWRRMEDLGYAFALQTGHTALYVDRTAR